MCQVKETSNLLRKPELQRKRKITNIHVVRLKKNATFKTLNGQTEEKLVMEKHHDLSI